MYIPSIDDYLKFLTDEEVEDFVAMNFRVHLKSIREEQNLIKVSKLLYIFPTTPDEAEKHAQSKSSDNCIHLCNVEILNLFDPELQLIDTKPMIKSKFKELVSELKKLKVHTILVLDYNKRNDRKIFHSSTKLIASVIIYASKYWIILEVVTKSSIKIFEC